jgi:hypothetical protein
MKLVKKMFIIIVIGVFFFSGTLTTQADSINTKTTPIEVTPRTQPPIMPLSYTLNLPAIPVTMTVYDNQVISYFDTYLSNVPDGYDVTNGGPYLGWCVEAGTGITRGVGHQVMLYSSYDPVMPVSFQNADWYKINYILNHKIGSEDEISIAIWYFCGEWPYGMPPNSQTMVNEANTYGAAFVPSEGEVIAVLADGGSTIQRTFFELLIPDIPPPVHYEQETAWAKGTRYVVRGSWAMYVTYDGGTLQTPFMAGQFKTAGTVIIEPADPGFVTITINLNEGYYFTYNETVYPNNIQIQDYASKPKENPNPGGFTYKFTATGQEFTSDPIPVNNYYGIHGEVWHQVPNELLPLWYILASRILASRLCQLFPTAFPVLRYLVYQYNN